MPYLAVAMAFLGFMAKRSERNAQADKLGRDASELDTQATDELITGSYKEEAQREKGIMMSSSQRVAYSNNGVDATFGTPAQVQEQTLRVSELDAQMIRMNAMRGAYQIKKHAANLREQADDLTGWKTIVGDAVGAGSSIVPFIK